MENQIDENSVKDKQEQRPNAILLLNWLKWFLLASILQISIPVLVRLLIGRSLGSDLVQYVGYTYSMWIDFVFLNTISDKATATQVMNGYIFITIYSVVFASIVTSKKGGMKSGCFVFGLLVIFTLYPIFLGIAGLIGLAMSG